MTIVLPAVGTAWERHDVPRGVCFAASARPGTTLKMFLVLPDDGDTCIDASVGEGATLEIITLQEGATGTVNALFEGFNVRGNPVRGEIGGRADEGRLSFSGTLDNGVRIDGSATRVR